MLVWLESSSLVEGGDNMPDCLRFNRTASVTDFVIVAVNSSTLKSLVSLDLVALLSGAD